MEAPMQTVDEDAVLRDADPEGKGSELITLVIGEEGEEIRVERQVIGMSKTIEAMLDDFEDTHQDIVVHVPNIDMPTMNKVLEFCQYRWNNPSLCRDERTKNDEWDDIFCDGMEEGMLLDVILATNYLDIKDLLVVVAKRIGRHLAELTPEKVREKYRIKNTWTKEEEERIRNEREWCENV